MTLDMYADIVGVAWSEVNNDPGFSYANAAVGINTNDAVAQMKKQQEEIASLTSAVNAITAYLKTQDSDFNAEMLDLDIPAKEGNNLIEVVPEISKTPIQPTVSRLGEFLDSRPDEIESILAHARQILDEKGIDYQRFDQTRNLLEDRAYFTSMVKEFQSKD